MNSLLSAIKPFLIKELHKHVRASLALGKNGKLKYESGIDPSLSKVTHTHVVLIYKQLHTPTHVGQG